MGLRLTVIVCVTCLAAAAQEPVTFYQHVLPILQKSCQSCHAPGEIGPMPLLVQRRQTLGCGDTGIRQAAAYAAMVCRSQARRVRERSAA